MSLQHSHGGRLVTVPPESIGPRDVDLACRVFSLETRQTGKLAAPVDPCSNITTSLAVQETCLVGVHFGNVPVQGDGGMAERSAV